MEPRPTAGIVVIGDEILKGQTQDTNSHFLCRELYACGVDVSRISVVPDDVAAIASEVAEHSRRHTFVLTSGGIGPTHDDVTYEAVAKAFGEELEEKEELRSGMARLCRGLGLDEPSLVKMSRVPASAKIHAFSFPVVSVRNVYVLPGIPSYLERCFLQLRPLFRSSSRPPFARTSLHLAPHEFEVASVIDRAAREFEGRVRIGSYPDVESPHFQVELSLEAADEGDVRQAEAFLRSHLPPNSVVGPHPPSSPESLQLLDRMAARSTSIRKSLEVLSECFERYSVDEVCVSFNGGKDCTALLHLTFLHLSRRFHPPPKIKVLYVRGNQPFTETEEFIQLSIKRYNLDLIAYEHPIMSALGRLRVEHPSLRAVLMGSRRSDPRCARIAPFQETDANWPRFMRVCPLCDWDYADVWNALRDLHVPYCSLYDRGYTSLGCQNNTIRNERLLSHTKSGDPFYLPAYMLQDTEREREGRTKHVV